MIEILLVKNFQIEFRKNSQTSTKKSAEFFDFDNNVSELFDGKFKEIEELMVN